MSEFKREERYIVLKRKGLYPEQESAIRELIDELGVLTTGCVVVEDDWPENEIVWRLIQARVEGKPNEIESLRQQLATTEQRLLEALAREKVLREMVGRWMCDEGWSQVDMDAVDNLDAEGDSTTLDNAIKQKQREALLDAADWFEANGWDDVPRALRRMAEELSEKD